MATNIFGRRNRTGGASSTSTSRTTRRSGNRGGQSSPSILSLMDDRREGTGLYSRTNVGTQATAREQANDAGTFARAVNPEATLRDRPDPTEVRDPFIDNATRSGIRSGIEDQEELRQDLVSGAGMNPVEYRAGLQALQATNQGLQPLMNQRTTTDTAEMEQIGATNRQLLGLDNTRMQGAMNLAQQAMQGDQQLDLARLEGGLALDETLMGALGDREAAAIEGAYRTRQAALESAMSPSERARLNLITRGVNEGQMTPAQGINALGGEALETGPEELIEVPRPGRPGETLMVPRDVAETLSYGALGETERGQQALSLQSPDTAARRFFRRNFAPQEGQETEGTGLGFFSEDMTEDEQNLANSMAFGFFPGLPALLNREGQAAGRNALPGRRAGSSTQNNRRRNGGEGANNTGG